jgi:hypothetical protein
LWREKRKNGEKEKTTCEGIQDHLHYQCQNLVTPATLPIADHAKSLLDTFE